MWGDMRRGEERRIGHGVYGPEKGLLGGREEGKGISR